MKIALVHDFLKEYGGAERVLEALHDIWPDAPVYTSFVDWKGLGPHAERLKSWKITQSWISRVPCVPSMISPLRFLAPFVWGSFDFSGFDVVISSSSWFMTKGISVQKPTVHICYLHTPPRYLYGYQTARDWQKYWPVRVYGMIVNHWLRLYDVESSQRVDYFIANSEETKRRITKFYRRDSVVIYPPVNVASADTVHYGVTLPAKYYLVVSRLARAKHIDIAIKACQKLNVPLIVVGKGADEIRLQQIANSLPRRPAGKSSIVRFEGEVPDEELPLLYQHAKALLFPAEDEEFGIVPVEAMGYGIPVVAYKSGGVVETVIDGKTGMFFDELTEESLIHAMKKCSNMKTITKEACVKRAKSFSLEVFEKKMRDVLERDIIHPHGTMQGRRIDRIQL